MRAILRASAVGDVRIMFPMVSTLLELRQCKMILAEVKEDLEDEGIAFNRDLPVGTMIEVPAAALMAEQMAREVDFFSIGTNDLTQYTLAMDRCQADLAAQADGLHPAVLRLIAATVQGANKHGKWVGVCGALAGDPLAMPLLVGLGVTELSVDPVSVPGIKARVRNLDYQLCRQRAQDALALESAQAVRAVSRETWPLD
jgi:phosphocarrier protein FPr